MWDKVEEYCSIGRENSSGSVSIAYESYGYYVCTVTRAYVKKMPIEVVGSTAEKAFDLAKRRVRAVEKLEKEIGKLLHVDSNTPNINKYKNGYSLLPATDEPQDQRKVLYKTKENNKYVIADLQLIDENGYLILEESKTLNGKLVNVNDVPESHCLFPYIETEKKHLKDGEELFCFDTLGFLSGSSGFVVVKNGEFLRTKTIVIS